MNLSRLAQLVSIELGGEKLKAPISGKLLDISATGCKLRFEANLRREQVKLLQRVFAQAGEEAVNGWLAINKALGQSRLP